MITRIGKSRSNAVGFPSSLGPEVVARLDAACQVGATSYHGTGIEPGWAAPPGIVTFLDLPMIVGVGSVAPGH